MITDEQWEVIYDRIMSLPGMRTDAGSEFMSEPVTEDVSSYIKFMSDYGVSDNHNGIILSDYLKANGCQIEQHCARSMIVWDADLVRLFL